MATITITPVTAVAVRDIEDQHISQDWDDDTFALPPLEWDGDTILYYSCSGLTEIRIECSGDTVTRIVWGGPARSFCDGVRWLWPTWHGEHVSLFGRDDRWRIDEVATSRPQDIMDRLGVPSDVRVAVRRGV